MNQPSFAGRVRNLANMHKPHIEVDLAGDSHVIRTFSTFDKIEGNVSLTVPVDTPFDSVEIALVGSTRSFVDKMATVSAVNSRAEAFQQFLKLEQPMAPNAYPSPCVFKPHQRYTFPFEFVVPEQLLPHSCRHRANNDKVKDMHLQLPPSLGDPEMSGYGSTLKDDLAPSMARIQYGVRVRVIRNRDRDDKEMILAAHTRKLCIIPATDEQPPVTFDVHDDEYCLRREKTLKRGVFKGKLGRLAIEASQPMSFRLPPPSATLAPPENVTTVTTINLRFDPSDASSKPPRLGSLSSKLKVSTYFASAPRLDFPTKANAVYDITQGLFIELLALSQRCVANVTWEKHDSPSSRRDSAVSLDAPAYDVSTVPRATKASSDDIPFYTAKLVVPLTLPTSKVFLPTFHSCLVSRVYSLELALAVPNQSAAPSSTMTLKVPVQVSAARSSEAMSRRASDIASAVAISGTASTSMSSSPGSFGGRNAELDAQLESSSPELPYFQPRRVGSVGSVPQTPALPPDYWVLQRQAMGGRALVSIPEVPSYTMSN